MSAEEYKAAHPDGWKDLREQVQPHEKNERQKIVDQLLQFRPQYVRSDENMNMLANALRSAGAPFTFSNLVAAFDELVASGKMKTNTAVDRKENGLRMVDYSKTGSREAVYPNQRAALPEKQMTDSALENLVAKIPSMSSAEFEQHCRTNRAFRYRVNWLQR